MKDDIDFIKSSCMFSLTAKTESLKLVGSTSLVVPVLNKSCI